MADNPNVGPKPESPARQPYGPGPLMVFGLGLLALAVYCFADLFIRGMPDEWRKAGNDWYIPLNWVIMIAAAIGAIYLFVLATKRSKTSATPPAQP
ncbi:MAG: hypothetical protein NTY65_10985 [Planctomycetota bacterium]|nr:hypothetical protein [Planctomycetota bacterium]